jgi:virginiamycin B lyase
MAKLKVFLVSTGLSLAAFASPAATGIFREQAIPGSPGGVTEIVGLAYSTWWFTEFDANRIGVLTRDGQFREFIVPTPDSGPRGIAYRTFTEYAIPSPQSAPWGIVEIGEEMWFTESAANKIGRVNKDGSITEFVIPTKNASPRGIASGPYSSPCFAEFGADQIGCLENGQIIERGLTPGVGPQDICLGMAGIWFTENTGNRVGVASFNGVRSLAQARIEEFAIPTSASAPAGIVAEISGVWFTEKSAGQIAFTSYDGRITEYPLADRSSQPTGIALSLFGAQFLESARGRVVEIQPDALVIPGAGTSGRWETILEVANVVARPASVLAGIYPRPPGISFEGSPPSPVANLSANGSGKIILDSSKISGLRTFFVRNLEEGVLPSVRGRIYNHDFPSQSADLPAIRLSTLTSLNPETLSFPGAVRNGSARTNLLISELSIESDVLDRQPLTMRVRVDLFASDGSQSASGEFAVPAGSSLYLVDVIGRLGVTTFQDGQIRVTRVGQEGRLWGYLATINGDGAISIFSGVNP